MGFCRLEGWVCRPEGWVLQAGGLGLQAGGIGLQAGGMGLQADGKEPDGIGALGYGWTGHQIARMRDFVLSGDALVVGGSCRAGRKVDGMPAAQVAESHFYQSRRRQRRAS